MTIHQNIYNFVNSKDIVAYWKEIGYEFSAPEAAFIVYLSNLHTLEQKTAAWERIIAELPDCSMAKRPWMKEIESFHGFLRAYINLQKQKLCDFYREDGSIYFYNIRYEDDMHAGGRQLPFSSAEKCIAALREEIADNALTDDSCVNYITLTKRPLDMTESSCKHLVYCDTGLNVTSVREDDLSCEDKEIDITFEGMWFLFPTPFEKGDILVSNTGFHRGIPFVFEGIIGDGEFSGKETAKRLKVIGDTTDMGYKGIFFADGKVYKNDCHNYLSLEFYKDML